MSSSNLEQITNEAAPTEAIVILNILEKAYSIFTHAGQLDEELQCLQRLKEGKQPVAATLKGRLDEQLLNIQEETDDLKTMLTEFDATLRNALLDQLQPALKTKHLDEFSKDLEPLSEYQLEYFITSYREQFSQVTSSIELLKRDKIENSVKTVVSEVLNSTNEKLIALLKEKEESSLEEMEKTNNSVDDMLNELHRRINENKMVNTVADSVYRNWTGLPRKEEQEKMANVSRLVREELECYLQQALINLLLYGSPTSQQRTTASDSSLKRIHVKKLARIKKKHAQRKKIKESLSKILKMEQEANEYLRLFDTVLNRGKVQHAAQRLSYLSDIAENHGAVLKFMNAPFGKHDIERPSIPEPIRRQIPQHVNLYKNGELSSAVAASIVQYTINMNPFADLQNRIEELEKKL